MYLIGNASFNSLCLGESFLCSFVYYCLSRNKVFEDFTRSSSLKFWKVVWGHIDHLSSWQHWNVWSKDSWIGIERVNLPIWCRGWTKFRLDYRPCAYSPNLKISTGTILLYSWRKVNYRRATFKKKSCVAEDSRQEATRNQRLFSIFAFNKKFKANKVF